MSLYESLANLAGDRAQRIGQARYGLVSAVDPTNHAVKVRVMPEDVESGWIPDPGLAAAGLRIACPCEIDTHVLIEAAEGDAEHPVVIGRLFDTTMTPPVSPVSNKPAQPGELLALTGSTFFHLQPGKITLGIGTATITASDTGFVFKVGNMTFAITSTGAAIMGGGLSADQNITTMADVVAGTISLDHHVHGGVQTGSATTETPFG